MVRITFLVPPEVKALRERKVVTLFLDNPGVETAICFPSGEALKGFGQEVIREADVIIAAKKKRKEAKA